MPHYSPLRYPGGKRRLFSVVTRLLEENGLHSIQYAEPYAGGAAVALSLLFEEYASSIHLNDLSRPIFALWDSVINHTDDVCERIIATPVTMEAWYEQRAVYCSSETADLTDLGFATLFLNRTNRSGILSGGVIGGKQQNGPWSLDARFNKSDLTKRINKIGRYRGRIQLYQQDALDFINQKLINFPSNSFAFFDPPYIESGKDLYLNNYTLEGHRALSEAVQTLDVPWICTYDHAAVESGLYPAHRRMEYRLPYTAQGKHQGIEVMFVSHNLTLPPEWSETDGPVRVTPRSGTYRLYGTLTNPNT